MSAVPPTATFPAPMSAPSRLGAADPHQTGVVFLLKIGEAVHTGNPAPHLRLVPDTE